MTSSLPFTRALAAALLLFASLSSLSGCGDDDALAMDAGAADAGSVDGAPPTDGRTVALCTPDSYPFDPGTCEPQATDYAPGSDTDGWAPCVSDEGVYVPIEPTISSIARVMAFERIAALLFDPTRDPTPEEFTTARMIYQEDEGLDSRVVRRFDPHYTVPDGTDCTMLGVPAMFPEYCVGPARIEPIVLDALNRGIAGERPRVQATRLEGALVWFLAISSFKESFTCTTTAKDCDSAWAYYTGGAEARCGLGLARYIAAVDPHAHDRAWDGALAVRCWRDLDSATVAVDLALRDRARAQLDRAILDGVAAVVVDRFSAFDSASGDERAAQWAFLTTLGPLLDREMEARDGGSAAVLRSELAKVDVDAVDVASATAAITSVFACP